MTALAANTEIKRRNLKGYMYDHAVVTSGVTVYQGSLLCFAASAATVRPASDTSGFRFAGMAEEKVVGDGTLKVRFSWGYEALLVGSSLTAPDVGFVACAVDDATITDLTAATNDVIVGEIMKVEASNSIWCFLRNSLLAKLSS